MSGYCVTRKADGGREVLCHTRDGGTFWTLEYISATLRHASARKFMSLAGAGRAIVQQGGTVTRLADLKKPGE